MSNYNELRLTYEGGRQDTITLSSSIINPYEYQGQDIVAVEVPEIVEEIGEYAFCDNYLTSITLNEGLQIINGQVFQHGTYSAITIPSTVTYIGMNAFNINDEQGDGSAGNLTITCLATVPPMLDDSESITFGNPHMITAIYVPSGSVSDYQNDWPQYASLITDGGEPETGFTNLAMSAAYVGLESAQKIYLGSDVIWQSRVFGGDVVYIDDSGVTHTDHYSTGVIPNGAYEQRDDIVSVTMGPGITSIGTNDGSYVFASCGNLSAVTIGPNVRYVGGRAFESTPLQNATIPASVITIDTNAFSDFNSDCTITFEGDIPQMPMQENRDLGTGTNIIVPDVYIDNYCSTLSIYNYNVVSDQGNTCGELPYSALPITLKVLSPGTIEFKPYNSTSYTADEAAFVPILNGTNIGDYDYFGTPCWYFMPSQSTSSKVINVQEGDVFQIYRFNLHSGFERLGKGNNENGANTAYYTFSGSTAGVELYGNILSMCMDPEEMVNYTTWHDASYQDGAQVETRYVVCGLFRYMTGLVSAENLWLPDDVPAGGYVNLFNRCTALEVPPKVFPAEIATPWCYGSTFQYCSSLIRTPIIKATGYTTTGWNWSVSNNGTPFYCMFSDCSHLVEATCFMDQTNMTSITYRGIFSGWLNSVSSTGNFYKRDGTSWYRGTYGIPQNWTMNIYQEE